jgi:hypothetical protein
MLPASSASLPDRPIPESYWVLLDQFLAGEYPGVHFGLERTIQRLDAFLQAGFNTFIDLTEADEAEPYESALREESAYYAIQVEYFRHSIGDFGLPTLAGMHAALATIDGAITHGRKIYLHCYGGIGRTGTTVGCYLVSQGRSGEQALAQLAEWWQAVPKHTRFPRSPETRAQADFIRNWSKQP